MTHFGSRNQVLAALSPEVVRSLDLKPVKLSAGDRLHRYSQHCRHLTFIEAGVVGISMPLNGTESADVLSLSYESVLGLGALVGQTRLTENATVRNCGWAYQAAVDRALSVMENHRSFEKAMFLAMDKQRRMSARNAACIASHSASQRLCRSLLFYNAHGQEDEVHINQGALGTVLGVRRSTVNLSLKALIGIQALQVARGRVRLLDVNRLSEIACSCLRNDNLAEPGSHESRRENASPELISSTLTSGVDQMVQ